MFKKKILLLLAILNSSSVLFGMQKEGFIFPPILIDTLTSDFFYEIYPGKNSEISKDKKKQIITLGQKEFYVIENKNYEEKKIFKSEQRIIKAHFSPSERFIIATPRLGKTIEIWDMDCKLIYAFEEDSDIQMGIFGENDYTVIINKVESNNVSKKYILPAIERLESKSVNNTH